ncbi:MAG TPA: phosphoribosylformylglycinamidine synthase subunit PurQ, partial [Actinomycetota bacterium]|nr:phosphoribosylformylglycinamidine synthase subunit PurQ [Actinomycetota bacterium]
MRAAVVVFPGSNCDRDCVRALAGLGAEAVSVWHERVDLAGAELVVLPGGFAHGDYLRTGALARFSPVMEAVRRHAAGGGHVVGICKGFQILCEAGMLPGALRRNDGLKFICREVGVSVETASDFTRRAPIGRVLRMPINHFEGNYFCDDATLAHLRARDRIVLRYVDNPNGSRDDIAGIVN